MSAFAANEVERPSPARKGLRTTLLVGQLPPTIPVDELTEMLAAKFSQYDDIVECEVITDQHGNSRNYAFIRLADPNKTMKEGQV